MFFRNLQSPWQFRSSKKNSKKKTQANKSKNFIYNKTIGTIHKIFLKSKSPSSFDHRPRKDPKNNKNLKRRYNQRQKEFIQSERQISLFILRRQELSERRLHAQQKHSDKGNKLRLNRRHDIRESKAEQHIDKKVRLDSHVQAKQHRHDRQPSAPGRAPVLRPQHAGHSFGVLVHAVSVFDGGHQRQALWLERHGCAWQLVFHARHCQRNDLRGQTWKKKSPCTLPRRKRQNRSRHCLLPHVQVSYQSWWSCQ